MDNVKRLEKLRKTAVEISQFRGHELRAFDMEELGGMTECVKCGMAVLLIAAPESDENCIYGVAITSNCPYTSVSFDDGLKAIEIVKKL